MIAPIPLLKRKNSIIKDQGVSSKDGLLFFLDKKNQLISWLHVEEMIFRNVLDIFLIEVHFKILIHGGD